jgi:hypothetical protein
LEILIEHYRLGMKLSMPVIVGDKTLLDSGAVIESNRMLDVVKANGVLKLDVHKVHIPELAEKHPEFYALHNEEVAKAKELGREGRTLAAEEWSKARRLSPKAPIVSILAKSQDCPDLQGILSPYFSLEHVVNRYREISGKLSRSKALVVWVDSFTDEELRFMQMDCKKENPELKFLAVVSETYTGPWPSVRWLGNGSQVFKALFLTLFPEKFSEFPIPMTGTHLGHSTYPSLQLIACEGSIPEVDQWLTKWEGLSVQVHKPEEAKPWGAKLTIFRFPNEQANICDHLAKLSAKGFNPQKMLIIIGKIAKEEVECLKGFGRLMVQVGTLDNEKTNNLMTKLIESSS